MRFKQLKNKIGLKLFSKNIEAIPTAAKLLENNIFDYLELMALPGTFAKTIGNWQELKLPFVIHAPHSLQGLNLSKEKLRKNNQRLFKETRKFADALEAEAIIIHPGLVGSVEETIRQIRTLKENRLVVENNPFISLFQTRCVGSAVAEIRQIMDETKVAFCLDIPHAVKTAFANEQDHFKDIEEFMDLNPEIIHICDCKIAGSFDEHLGFGEGQLDFIKIFKMIANQAPHARITLEIPEKSYAKLTNFKKDRLWIEMMIEKGCI